MAPAVVERLVKKESTYGLFRMVDSLDRHATFRGTLGGTQYRNTVIP